MSRGTLLRVVRLIRIDTSYLSGGHYLFQIQFAVILFLDVVLLTVFNALGVITNPTQIFERFSLIFAFATAIGTITAEFKGEYTDSIQLLYGSWSKRHLLRIAAVSIHFWAALNSLAVIFSHTPKTSPLHINFSLTNIIGFDLALALMIALGVMLGSILRATFLANFLPSLVLILDINLGGFLKGSHLTFSGLFIPLLAQHASFLHLSLISIAYSVASALCFLTLARYRSFFEDKLTLPAMKSRKFRLGSKEPLTWKVAHAIDRVDHDIAIRYAQLFTNVQFLRLPFLFLWLGILPLINNKLLTINAPERVLLPIIAASIIQSIILISLLAPTILEGKEYVENEKLLFNGEPAFRKATELLWQIICSLWSFLIVAVAVMLLAFGGARIDYLFSLRPALVVVILSPLVVHLTSFVLRLELDQRFIMFFGLGYFILDSAIMSSIPQLSRFAPSGLIANLAGGRGLYQIVQGEPSVPSGWIVAGLFLVTLIAMGAKNLRQREDQNLI